MSPVLVHASSVSVTTRITAGMRPTTDYVSTGKAWARTVSDDGRFSVFTSNSKQLISGDTSIDDDVFIYDREMKKMEIVRGPNGERPERMTFSATISGNGRFVAFFSYSASLVPGAADLCKFGCLNLYVYDRQTKQISLANRSSQGRMINVFNNAVIYDQPALSRDGRFITFRSLHALSPKDTNHSDDIMLRDLKTGVTQTVSVDSAGNSGKDPSGFPGVSQDGRYVSFATTSALVPEDSNGVYDVYLRDTQQGKTRLVTRGLNNVPANSVSAGPVISQNGRFITFVSWASNIAPDDTNNYGDVFLYDIAADTFRRVSVGRDGVQTNGHSYEPDISDDGRFVVYASQATNLVRVDTNSMPDIFIYDRDFGLTRRVSLGSHDGVQADSYSERPSISGNGRAVSFVSEATNLSGEPSTDIPPYQLYLNYNPVVSIPYYDPIDWLGF